MSNYTSNDIINAIAAAAKALEARKDEINRLNVFPVPDGDTGTNMSLTLAMVVDNLAKLQLALLAKIAVALSPQALLWAHEAIRALLPLRSCAACAKALPTMRSSILLQ